MDRKYKVVLADDHQLLTSGLRMAIDGWEEFEVVGVGSDGRETVALCEEFLPDIVLIYGKCDEEIAESLNKLGVARKEYPPFRELCREVA